MSKLDHSRVPISDPGRARVRHDFEEHDRPKVVITAFEPRSSEQKFWASIQQSRAHINAIRREREAAEKAERLTKEAMIAKLLRH